MQLRRTRKRSMATMDVLEWRHPARVDVVSFHDFAFLIIPSNTKRKTVGSAVPVLFILFPIPQLSGANTNAITKLRQVM